MISLEGVPMHSLPVDTTSSSEVNKEGTVKGANRMSLVYNERKEKDKKLMQDDFDSLE